MNSEYRKTGLTGILRNLILGTCIATLGALIGSGLMYSYFISNGEISVRKFVVVDATGKTAVQMDENGLLIYDRTGSRLVALSIDPKMGAVPGLFFYDNENNVRFMAGVIGTNSEISINDDKGHPRLALGFGDNRSLRPGPRVLAINEADEVFADLVGPERGSILADTR